MKDLYGLYARRMPTNEDVKANIVGAISKIKRFYEAGFEDGVRYGILCGTILGISMTSLYIYIRFNKMLPTAIKVVELCNLTKEPIAYLQNAYNIVCSNHC